MMITKIDNFIDETQIKELIDLIEELPHTFRSGSAGKSNKGVNRSTVGDDVTFPGSGSVTEKQRKRIYDVLFRRQNTIDDVFNKVTCGEFDNIFSTIDVYNEGDFYDWHLDRLTSGRGKSVDVSYTVFLNDPEEYDGGSLLVEHEYGISSFKEKAGSAVFYPSACLHRVDEILRGRRKVVLGLISCTVSSPHDRHLLTELSNCINGIDDYSNSLANIMIDGGKIDNINRRLQYVTMQLHKRFMKNN